MAPVRTLSAVLNLDISEYSRNAEDAGRKTTALGRQLSALGGSARDLQKAVGSSVSSLEKFAGSLTRAARATSQVTSARASFIASLVRENQTLGLNARQLQEYEARQLGVWGATRRLIEANEAKRKSVAAAQAADRDAAAVAKRVALAEDERAKQAEKFIKAKRDELLVLREGAEALELQRAEQLRVADVYRTVVGEIKAETAAQRERLQIERGIAAFNEKQAAIKADQKAKAEGVLAQMREEIALLTRGEDALKRETAAAAGLGHAFDELNAKLRETRALSAEGSARLRDMSRAPAQPSVGPSARGNGETYQRGETTLQAKRDELLILREGQDAILKKTLATKEQREEYARLDAQIKAVNATRQREAEIAAITAARREEISARQAGVVAGGENTLQGLRDELLVLRQGEDALAQRTLATRAQREEYARLVEEIRNVTAAKEKEAAAEAAANEEKARAAAIDKARLDRGQAIIESMRQEIDVLTRGRDAINAEAAAVAGLGAEYERLKPILDEARRKQAELDEQERRMRGQPKLNLSEQERFLQSLRREVTSMREAGIASREGASGLAAYRAAQLGLTAESAGLVSELRLLEEEMDKTAGHGRGMSRVFYELNVLVHELSSGRINRAIGSFSILLNQFAGFGAGVFGITLTLGLLYGMSRPIEEAAKRFQDLDNRAKELGVSTDYLQKMGVAADLTGKKVDDIAKAMQRVDNAFARARAGAKQPAAGFAALGIDTKQNYTSQELFDRVVDGMGKMPDGPSKVSASRNIMGVSGAESIPVLDKLASSMGEINRLTEKYGIVNRDAVEQGKELAHNFDLMKIASEGLGNALIAALGPSLNKFLSGMTEGTARLTAFLSKQSTIQAIDQTMRTLGATMGFLGGAIHVVMENLPAFSAALLLLMRGQAIAEMFAGLRMTILAFSAAAAIAGPATTTLAIAQGAAARAAVGLGGALRGVLTIVGGPLGAALIALSLAYNFVGKAERDAKNAASDLRSSQEGAADALKQGIDFAKKYGLNTASLTTALARVTGSAPDVEKAVRGIADAHKEAAKQALLQAEAERQLAIHSLQSQQFDAKKKARDLQNSEVSAELDIGLEKYGPLSLLIPGQKDRVAKARKNLADIQSEVANQNSIANILGGQITNLQNQKITPEAALAANAPGDTRADALKGPGKGLTPDEKLTEEILKLRAQLAGQQSFLFTDDPVAQARAQAQGDIDERRADAALHHQPKIDDDQAAQYIQIQGQLAAIKEAHSGVNKIVDEQRKAVKDAAAAWADYDTNTSAVDKQIVTFNTSIDDTVQRTLAQAEASKMSSVQLVILAANLRDYALAAKEANANAQLADIAIKAKQAQQGLNSKSKNPLAQGANDFSSKMDEYGRTLQEATDAYGTSHDADALKKAQDAVQSERSSYIDDFLSGEKGKADQAGVKSDGLGLDKITQAYDEHQQKLAEINATWQEIISRIPDATQKIQAQAVQMRLLQTENEEYADKIKSPFQKQAQEWQDTTTEMGEDTKKWGDDFINKAEEGKLKFKDFTTEVLHDYLDMMLRAMMGPILQQSFDGLGNLMLGGMNRLLGTNVSPIGGYDGLAASPIGSLLARLFNNPSVGAFNSSMSASILPDGTSLSPLAADPDLTSMTAISNTADLLPFPTFHTGGIVGSGGRSMTRVSPSVFFGAPKFHDGGLPGLQPNEVPAILKAGEGVFTKDQMAAIGAKAAAPPVTINFNNQSGMALNGDDDGSHFDGKSWVLNLVVDHATRPGPLRNAIRNGP